MATFFIWLSRLGFLLNLFLKKSDRRRKWVRLTEFEEGDLHLIEMFELKNHYEDLMKKKRKVANWIEEIMAILPQQIEEPMKIIAPPVIKKIAKKQEIKQETKIDSIGKFEGKVKEKRDDKLKEKEREKQ